MWFNQVEKKKKYYFIHLLNNWWNVFHLNSIQVSVLTQSCDRPGISLLFWSQINSCQRKCWGKVKHFQELFTNIFSCCIFAKSNFFFVLQKYCLSVCLSESQCEDGGVRANTGSVPLVRKHERKKKSFLLDWKHQIMKTRHLFLSHRHIKDWISACFWHGCCSCRSWWSPDMCWILLGWNSILLDAAVSHKSRLLRQRFNCPPSFLT